MAFGTEYILFSAKDLFLERKQRKRTHSTQHFGHVFVLFNNLTGAVQLQTALKIGASISFHGGTFDISLLKDRILQLGH